MLPAIVSILDAALLREAVAVVTLAAKVPNAVPAFPEAVPRLFM